MASWSLAPTLVRLRNEVNAAAPKRSKRSDGTIGDAKHSARLSDHNPDNGWVDAIDLTHDPAGGFDAHRFGDVLAARADSRVSYLISNGRIWNPSIDRPGVWRRYTGVNPHRTHLHVSVRNDHRHSAARWLNVPAPAKPAPKPQTPASASPVPSAAVPAEGAIEMFLIVQDYGIFAVIDGVPTGFPDLAAYADASGKSKGVPVMYLPRKVGEPLVINLVKKLGATLQAGGVK